MAQSDAFYNELLVEVNEVIAEFGTTYNVVTPGVYEKRNLRVGLPKKRTVQGLVSDGSMVSSLVQGEGAVKQWVSNRILILTADADVQRNERVIVDGAEHSLDKVEKVQPADINLLYILDLTK